MSLPLRPASPRSESRRRLVSPCNESPAALRVSATPHPRRESIVPSSCIDEAPTIALVSGVTVLTTALFIDIVR